MISFFKQRRKNPALWAQDRGCKTTEGVKGLMTAQEGTRGKALSPILRVDTGPPPGPESTFIRLYSQVTPLPPSYTAPMHPEV